jgi:hypothetical protein
MASSGAHQQESHRHKSVHDVGAIVKHSNTMKNMVQIKVHGELEPKHSTVWQRHRTLIHHFMLISFFVFIGLLFFGTYYGWTAIDCFYFAIVTIATVGSV